MKRFFFILILSAAAAAATVQSFFTPGDDCSGIIAAEINKAQYHVAVQAYGFSRREIAAALIAAHARGCVVEIVLDKSNRTAKYSAMREIIDANMPVLIDASHAIAHNKIIIIDANEVITGSFNFTDSAQTRNAENIAIIHDPNTASRYLINFYSHKHHSTPAEK